MCFLGVFVCVLVFGRDKNLWQRVENNKNLFPLRSVKRYGTWKSLEKSLPEKS